MEGAREDDTGTTYSVREIWILCNSVQHRLNTFYFCAISFLTLFPWITDMKLSSSLKEMKPIIKLPYLSICVVFA